MRVDSRSPVTGNAALAGARRPAAPGGFSLGAGPEAAATGGPAAATSLAGLDAVLTLQGAEEAPQERRRRHARRGHDLLDGLDRLKAALLTGRVPTGELRAIAGRLSEQAGASGDPRLDGLVADIELRAAVELAKLEMRGAA
ncbi:MULTISPECIES: flagellar assembly protein FliX [Methylobacterium]|nr:MULTISPECIES: flagellar assembly protein FliX [Methylobacterium]PIU08050.1 MAG: flagellar assembly protein fliX [Methylobacterium sp. CG09_land_8_20_14_0_10_71_15]PIU14639.1 MAG: flagellar assembly protein fliX [Methylobacterium sp. CG08_land_8_20_14_0_20_71_15]GBU18825.1 flagellar assembly protein FliX [Methylobacterium sp.]